MTILKKGSLIIHGEDFLLSGYEFDMTGVGMHSVCIEALEEGVKDLQAQIEKAKTEVIEVTDGGGNFLNGKDWRFGKVKLPPFKLLPPGVRFIDNDCPDSAFFCNEYESRRAMGKTQLPNIESLPQTIRRMTIYFLLAVLIVGVGLAVFL